MQVTRETIALTVSLKIPDNEARSALEAVQVKMGLGDRVRDLTREEVWELSVEPGAALAPDGAAALETDAATARAAIERIVATTNLFANPNKHRHEIAAATARDLSLDPDEIAVLVSDRESARSESMVKAVRRLGAASVLDARRWVRWRLRLAWAPSEGDVEIRDLVRRVAVADAREGGLLCNPHIQEAVAVLPWGEEVTLVR